MTTIYVSSTYEDLKDHRRAVFEVLREAGYQVVAMETDVARDQRPMDSCLEDVARSDIYVGLFGLRYGYVPPPEHGNRDALSITELEFRKADAQPGTVCLTFVLDEKHTAPPAVFIDSHTGENERGARIRCLREHLLKEKRARLFSYSDPNQLAGRVQAAVAKHLQKTHPKAAPSELAPPTTWSIAERGLPYPGLMHFTREYQDVFFGREAESVDVLDRLHERPFVIVSGDSGTGKSSLVDAGVLPRLEAQAETSVRCARMVPSVGTDPFDALMRALHGEAERSGLDAFREGERLAAQPERLTETLQRITSKGIEEDTLLLFLDQMEELFVMGRGGRDHAGAFLASLFEATEKGVLKVLATIRSDLLHHCYAHPDMLSVLRGRGHYPLGHMPVHALHDVIVKPARCAGLEVPEPLASRLIEDVGREPGNLPLLAFALQKLCDRSERDALSLRVYEAWGGEELGGLQGAIAEHSAEVERGLIEDEDLELDAKRLHERLREIFPRLVRVDLEGLPTRRRARIEDFGAELLPIVRRLVRERLLSTEGKGAESTASVAHERLFEAWPSLQRWVAANQEDLRVHRQAELEAAEWQRQYHDLVHLWHPDRLKRLQAIVAGLPDERSSPAVREFSMPQQRLLELLDRPALSHEERRTVGTYLAELGDPRPGTGVGADGLPDIDWVSIPGGRVVLEGEAGAQSVRAFEMARYPITNAQFQAFVADDFRNQEWWRDMPPEMPDELAAPNWPEPSGPRENVSWYEAVAFCRWLSDRLAYEVRLPTEFEWQQAATGGNAENVYPWGPGWDASRANSTESRLNRTTLAGAYPHGASAQGVLDLAGNVWEWCPNKYELPEETGIDASGDLRVLRGGSWGFSPENLRSASRNGSPPDRRYDDIGFRVVCRPHSSTDS